MNFSVIVATANRAEELKLFLKSLSAQTLLPTELIIIDGSDTNKTEIMLKNMHLKFSKLIYKRSRKSLTLQRNIGIDISKGEVVFFFDDDVVLDSEYIEKVIEIYENEELDNVGGVQGIDLNINKSFLEGKKRLLFYRLFFLDRTDKFAKLLRSGLSIHLDVASPEIRYAKTPIRIYCMSGCMMSYSCEAIDDIKFDEILEGYTIADDVDFSHRISRKYKLYYTPHAKLSHNQSLAKKDWYRTGDFAKLRIKCQVFLFRKLLADNFINYFIILWSWFGLLIWNGCVHPNKAYFIGNLKAMKEQFVNIFRPIKKKVSSV